MSSEFRKQFWQPPRAHGEVIEDRRVSFLELFYDLVYVVVIARAAHTLAEDITWRTVAEFAVIFGMIWVAWLNGTLYYDLHGREDGRTRTYVFLQMLMLSLLAVFTGDAAGEGGAAFAAIYTGFLMLLTLFWYSVRRQDSDEYRPVTARYLSAMVAAVVVVGFSIFMPDESRLYIWGAFVLLWLVAAVLTARGSELRFELGVTSTHSTVERFGLFTIIVLGEVVVGVVEGLSNSSRGPLAIVTGMLGLMVGFAYWWTYFDFVGQRMPAEGARKLTRWMMGHLPMAMAIAASGAAMVSLIEHATDTRSPAATAWLLAASVSLGLVALVALMKTLADYDRLPSLYRAVTISILIAAVAALVVGWIRPAPWLLTLMLLAILVAVWVSGVNRWLNLANPSDGRADAGRSEALPNDQAGG
ncbi:MAG: low temperature requirement protein A [Acidimicrobiia bacterium]